jgi:N-methylhydantoinase A
VTDANLLLNRLGAESLQAGGVDLNVGMAREAVRRVARHFTSLDETKTAEGIIRIAVARMVSAIKTITVRKGHDPREFTLVAYGGAGPMHASLIADELAIGRILIPPAPGNFSALGLLLADHRTNLVRSRISRSEQTPLSLIRSTLSELEDEGRRKLADVIGTSKVAFERWVGIRYLGQWYEIDVPFDPTWRKTGDFIRDFNRLHQEMYGHSEPAEETLVVHYRVSAYALLPKPVFSTQAGRRAPRPVARRQVHFGDEFVQANIFNRHDLGLGAQIHGPAIVEEAGSSTVLPPGWNAKVDQWGILVLERGEK